jgi:16S rRNA (cytosine967-C5)-methyltransferase
MAEQKKKTARLIAAEVLNQCDPRLHYAGAILNRLLEQTDQRQRATDLAFGSIRNLIAIDNVIDAFAGCPIDRIQKKLLSIIRIGCYELVFSPSTQLYSIINEAAENARAVAGNKQVGFVNALLHKIERHITNRQAELSQVDAKRTLIQTATTGCEFDIDFLPDRENQPTEYLSTVFSLPQWLVADWLAEYGKESTYQICLAQNRRPSIYLRPNSLKTTVQELAQLFKKEDLDPEIVPDVSLLRIKSPHMVTQLPGFEEGFFVVQDMTASGPTRLLEARPDWMILDLCAAPGVKTTQLAEVTCDSAKIIATDIDSKRLKKVKENSNRLGINSLEIVPYQQIPEMKFDCILLDVPCSNTGVLAKRVEVRYRIHPESVNDLTKTQSDLLHKAAGLLKPLGKICYSTCSIQRQENGDMVKDFIRKNPDFVLESEQLVLPSTEGFDRDGGYTAVLSKVR